jgi:hypothetical protein
MTASFTAAGCEKPWTDLKITPQSIIFGEKSRSLHAFLSFGPESMKVVLVIKSKSKCRANPA